MLEETLMDKLLDMEKHSRGWVEQNLYEPLVARSESLSQFNNLTCNLCLVVGIIEVCMYVIIFSTITSALLDFVILYQRSNVLWFNVSSGSWRMVPNVKFNCMCVNQYPNIKYLCK
jgi:hypothetical protein